MRELWLGLLDLLVPPACAVCGAPPPPTRALCASCEALFATAPPDPPAPPPLEAWAAAMAFEGAVAEWLHRFKYPPRGLRGLDPAPGALARTWLERSARRLEAGRPDLVVPVPLHPRRLRERGFNPACLLARALARSRGLPLAATALRRLRDTPSQTGLDRRARRRNVRGAFAATRPAPGCVWLVDDVVTTGATLLAAARALRRAGARRISALCVARTPPPDASAPPSRSEPRGAGRDRSAS